jgi:flagellar biosynthesis/type III secretory pathway protein FliH
MSLLRSRTPTAEATLVANPGVVRALSDRVAAAREEGRRIGLAEAETRIRAAEQRAAQAEQAAEARQQQREQEFRAKFDPPLTALVGAAARLEPLEKRLVQESEGECVRLALAIAAAILRREIRDDPLWMDAVVKAALLEIPDRRTVVIRMHPLDAEVLGGRIRDLRDAVAGLDHVEITADGHVARGTCQLMSRGTRVEASLPGCWERLAVRLLEAAPSAEVTEHIPPAREANAR